MTALAGRAWGDTPFSASSEPYGLSPRGQPEWDRRRAWWGYLKRWLETVTWVLARSWLRQHLSRAATTTRDLRVTGWKKRRATAPWC